MCDTIENLLEKEHIPYAREVSIYSKYDNEKYGRLRADFIIDNKIVLEIKYRRYLTREDYMQTQRYLKQLNLALGILVNFRDARLYPKRVLNGGGKE